jgi:hypothetical protein
MDLAKLNKKVLQQMCFDKGILIKVSDSVDNLAGYLNGDSTVNYTEIRCDKNTVDVIKMFIAEHMNYRIPCDTPPQQISKIQDKIRKQIQPYMKKKLEYLKNESFRNGEFYSIFALIIVIDKIKVYDCWKHINMLLFVNYDLANRVIKNEYGVSLIDNYFRPQDVNDATTKDGIDCCCGKRHIHLVYTVGFSNDIYTFNLGSFCINKTSIEYYDEKKKKKSENDKEKEREKERERHEQERMKQWKVEQDKIKKEQKKQERQEQERQDKMKENERERETRQDDVTSEEEESIGEAVSDGEYGLMFCYFCKKNKPKEYPDELSSICGPRFEIESNWTNRHTKQNLKRYKAEKMI